MQTKKPTFYQWIKEGIKTSIQDFKEDPLALAFAWLAGFTAILIFPPLTAGILNTPYPLLAWLLFIPYILATLYHAYKIDTEE